MINLSLQLSDGYKASRRITVLLCACALAWATAQLELESISFESIGAKIGIPPSSIPLILVTAILYAVTRNGLEYAMQSVEVRRWGYARVDFGLIVNLVRVTLVLLAVGVLHRSLINVFYTLLAVGVCSVAFIIGAFLLTMVVMFILVFLSKKNRRASAAGMAAGAVLISGFLMMVFAVIFLLCFGFFSMYSQRVQLLFWTEAPNTVSLWIFVCTCSIVIIDLYFQRRLDKLIFSEPETCLKKFFPDGQHILTFRLPPPIVWDWCIQLETSTEYEDAVNAKFGHYETAPERPLMHDSSSGAQKTD